MEKRGYNMYQRARKESLLTQEEAAERLYLSAKSVKAYEQGLREPDNGTVARMAEIYGTPWLLLEHAMRSSRALGILPEGIALQGLPTAVLTLVNRCLALSDDYRRLMAIAEDGVVDEEERPEYDRIAQRVRDVVAAGFQVLYAEGTEKAKKERPDGDTSKRSGVWDIGKDISNNRKAIIPQSPENSSAKFATEGGVSL